MRSGGSRAKAKAGAALAIAAVVAAIGVPGAGRADSSTPSTRAATALSGAPNFLFVLVDDQATNSFKRRYMPLTFRRVVDQGTSFTNALAAPPLCCPDRAGIITGQYPHNHGVFSNDPGYAALRDPGDTLPVWLHRAGYETALFGKFLNRYGVTEGATPAPGFDRWFELLDDSRAPYYDYRASDQGTVRRFGHRRSDYSTDVLTRKAKQFLRGRRGAANPFFAWVAYNAPHVATIRSGPCRGRNPAAPGKAAFRRFERVRIPRPPSFNEADVSDKPGEIAALPRLTGAGIRQIRRRWDCTLAAVHEVDTGVGRLIAELRHDGELSSTIVIYLSDNGLFFGEHRLKTGKGFIYEPALRVPFAVRVPKAFRSSRVAPRVGALVSNQDIAPTTLEYASAYGAPAEPCAGPGDCRRMDGRSLRPLLGGPGTWDSGRGVLAEIDSRKSAADKGIDPECGCAYEAIRTARYVYSELSSGERELYDLRTDPNELSNRAGSVAYSTVEQELAARLALLEQCSGIEGRDPPAAAPFCE